MKLIKAAQSRSSRTGSQTQVSFQNKTRGVQRTRKIQGSDCLIYFLYFFKLNKYCHFSYCNTSTSRPRLYLIGSVYQDWRPLCLKAERDWSCEQMQSISQRATSLMTSTPSLPATPMTMSQVTAQSTHWWREYTNMRLSSRSFHCSSASGSRKLNSENDSSKFNVTTSKVSFCPKRIRLQT